MASVIICPACQTRNRPTWEYCARCGESLDRVPVAEAESPRGAAPSRDLGALYLVLMVAVLAITSALACRDIATHPAPPAPSPGVFSFGGLASPSPTPAPGTQAGNADADAGRRLLAQGKAAESIGPLEKAAAENPDNAEFQNLLGRAHWAAGERDVALRSYADAARLDPASFGVPYAQTLETVGRFDDAVAQFEAVIAVQPGSAVAQEGLGRLYVRRGDFARALPLLEDTARQTRDPVVLQQLAYAAEKTGDRDRAIAAYRDVLAAAPGADVARGLLAENLLAAGQGDAAIGVLREGLQRTPQAPLLQRDLGSLLERTGRPADAAAAYREYARLAPNAPDAAQMEARAAKLEGSSKGSGS